MRPTIWLTCNELATLLCIWNNILLRVLKLTKLDCGLLKDRVISFNYKIKLANSYGLSPD